MTRRLPDGPLPLAEAPGSALTHGALLSAQRAQERLEAVEALHVNAETCVKHGVIVGYGHDCEDPRRTYRCPTCAQRDTRKPCPTWAAIHPEGEK